MNKSQLVDAVARGAGMSRSAAEGAINAFFDTVRSEVKSGSSIGWPGFGKFTPSARAARTARNPQTGESVKVKASTGMRFKSSSVLKEFLNTKGSRRAAAKRSVGAEGGATAASKKASGATAAAKKAPTSRSAAKPSAVKATEAAATRSAGSASTARKATAPAKAARKAPARRAAR